MTRYIDADRLINQFEGNGGIFTYGRDTVKAIVKRIKLQPTADVEEVKHGHFLSIKAERETHGTLTCSCCKYTYARLYPRNYCPYCGAKMDAEVAREMEVHGEI